MNPFPKPRPTPKQSRNDGKRELTVNEVEHPCNDDEPGITRLVACALGGIDTGGR